MAVTFTGASSLTDGAARAPDPDIPGRSGRVPGTADISGSARHTCRVETVLAFVGGAVAIAVGVLVVTRKPRHPVGWLLIAHGMFFVTLAFSGTSTSHAGLVFDQLSAGAWVFLFLFLVLIAYLLPDGHLENRFWRRWVKVGLVGVVFFVVGAAGDRQGFANSHHGAAPPVPWLPEGVSGLLGGVGLLLVVLLFFGSFVAVWRRMRRARGDEKLQLLWLVWGALSVPVALMVGWANYFLFSDGPFFTPALALVAVALPVTIGIAILRHRLFDIRLVLSRTLTYLFLVVAVVVVYAALLFVTGRLFGNRTVGGLLAVGIVAVAVHPAYLFLRRWSERWVYGLRSDPHVAIRLMADRAEAADPDGLIAAVTDAVAVALRVNRVWVELSGPAPDEADVDTVDAATLRTPMVHRGEQVGYLAVEVPEGRDFSERDLDLLADLARYAAILVRSERLNDELRDSRSRIIAGREEERRRLRRDLHDGLGPTLAATVLKLNAAQSRTDALERDSLLAETRDEVKEAITEVRRLVDDLRPPAIDEVGLLDAIRQRASALSGVVTFEVTGSDGLAQRTAQLPAAVEVVAFRIASEAMTNVVRHSGATRCLVRVELNGSFQLTVSDNGRGSDRNASGGVGWTSMRERAAELGGSCTITSQPSGGLIVRAVLPLVHDLQVDADK
jgi:two-component system, NarL family, sensor kinase